MDLILIPEYNRHDSFASHVIPDETLRFHRRKSVVLLTQLQLNLSDSVSFPNAKRIQHMIKERSCEECPVNTKELDFHIQRRPSPSPRSQLGISIFVRSWRILQTWPDVVYGGGLSSMIPQGSAVGAYLRPRQA